MAGNHNSGRKRTPTSKLKLYGRYQASRHENRDDERLAIGEPEKLPGMSADGRKVFDLVAKTLPADALSRLDGPLLAGTAEWFAVYWSIHCACKKSGKFDGNAMIAATTAWKNFLSGATQFGMSPTSRAKFERAGKESGDDLATFMNQAK